MTGKCPLSLGGSEHFRARAFTFQLGSHTDCLVSQGAGHCRREAGPRAERKRSRALSTNQADWGGPAERDVTGKAEWADCGVQYLTRPGCARTSGLVGTSSPIVTWKR